MPTKRNSAGQQQPYVPPGHGDASGEYADHAYGSNTHYASPDDVRKQLGYTPPQAKTESETPKELENKLNGTHTKEVKDEIFQSHKFTPEQKTRVENILKNANKDCLEHIENLKDVHYARTNRTAFYQPATNSVNLSINDWIDETRPDGETFFHEFGHAINHNSKYAGFIQQEVKYRSVARFVADLKAPASSAYVSEKYGVSMQDMLKKEYKENMKAYDLKAQIEKEKNDTITSRLIEKIGKENYNNYIEDKELIAQEYIEKTNPIESAMTEKRNQLYSGKMPFLEFDKYQKDYIQDIHRLRDERDEKLKGNSKKYGNVDDVRLNIAKEVQKDIVARYGSLSDVVDGANRGALNLIGFGHSKKYWGSSSYTRGDEFFAEAFSAKATNPKGYEVFNKYFPKTMEIFEEILKGSK